MEFGTHIQSPRYPSQHLSLDSRGGFSRSRKPLLDATVNSQIHDLSPVVLYHETKELQARGERAMQSMPAVTSQLSCQPLGNTLDLRRQSNRRRRNLKFSRNPIVDSPQYQAYRDRQNRDGNSEDAKWPETLEIAFLDALIEIPAMGRRKFSYKGKPHGRNELIKEYLWIAYLQSLAPGTSPDPNMMRTRKQVSSHIQVLKGFLKDHPAFDRLFPGNKGPKDGLEDSFKNDPCLRALSEGQLPSKQYEHNDNINQLVMNHHASVKPVLFWLLMTSSRMSDDANGREVCEEDLQKGGLIAHKFSSLSEQMHRDNLESIPTWRQRFPHLQELHAAGEVNCDIIHMDSSLKLLTTRPQEGSELCCRTVLSLPGRQPHGSEWRVVTMITKPPGLDRGSSSDPTIEIEAKYVEVRPISDVETTLTAPFPAETWAKTFSCLVNLMAEFEESRKASDMGAGTGSSIRPVQEYVDQISMYQEIQSTAGPRTPFIRRAIIIWTFHQARDSEGNVTNWRYLDPSPPRRMCMSPSPHSGSSVPRLRSENLKAWADVPLNVHTQNNNDPLVQDFATPTTAGLHSSFEEAHFALAGQPLFDLPGEILSFDSHTEVDSASTLINHGLVINPDHLRTGADINPVEYDHDASLWHMPGSESFDTDPAWENYAVLSSSPIIDWDTDKGLSWTDPSNPKQISWMDKSDSKHDWDESPSSPSKELNYTGQNIEQKLLPWVRDQHEDEVKTGYNDVHMRTQDEDENVDVKNEVSRKTSTEEWNVADDAFGYSQLTERLN